MNADRNLLLGILALQNNFIDRHQLVVAFDRWTTNKAVSLADILEHQGAINTERRLLVEALMVEHLKLHEDDAERSIAQLAPDGALRDELRQLDDVDVEASLRRIAVEQPVDPFATEPPKSVGESTSLGLRFRIIRPHAQGGLGKVSVARDEEVNREVALKEIQQRYADDQESRRRFLLEAEVTGGLEHPGIVPVYGLGQYADGRPFYAMRFVRGDSLNETLQEFHSPAAEFTASERNLRLRKLLQRLIDVCDAIHYAHSRGVLHRDLKPGNIMLGKYGETLVVDWGLARAQYRTTPAEPSIRSIAEEPSLQPRSGATPTLSGEI